MFAAAAYDAAAGTILQAAAADPSSSTATKFYLGKSRDQQIIVLTCKVPCVGIVSPAVSRLEHPSRMPQLAAILC
jgi:hypothetical protein